MRARGTTGVLRVGYQDAVGLNRWDLTCSRETLGPVKVSLNGLVYTFDQFWSTQSPMNVGLFMGPWWWVWKSVKVSLPKLATGTVIELSMEGLPAIHAKF